MATYWIVLFAVLSFTLSFSGVRSISAFLNVEELKSVNYAIDILDKPVVSGQDVAGPIVHLMNKYGQEYQCSLPEILPLGEEYKEEPKSADSPMDISEILKPMETAPCLLKTKDWWTYEFCYGKVIKQYHLEDNKVSGPVLTLGNYDSEYSWSDESDNSRNRLQRFHSQYYVNGTKCDLTGEPRKAEIRFICEEGAGDYIYRVDEPESCNYILTIRTNRICHHPYLKPLPSNKPKPIFCYPLLNSNQFEAYLRYQEGKQKEAEERHKQWLVVQQELLHSMKQKTEVADRNLSPADGEDAKDMVENVKQKSADSESSVFPAESVSDQSKKQFSVEGNTAQEKARGEEEEATEEDDLLEEEEVEEKQKETEQMSSYATAEDLTEAVSAKDSTVGQEAVEGKDQDLSDDANKELPLKQEESLHNIKHTLRKKMQAEFNTLINEFEEGLEAEVEDDGQEAVYWKLTKALNKLLTQLDKAEKDMKQVSKELGKVQSFLETEKVEEDEEKKPSEEKQKEVRAEEDEAFGKKFSSILLNKKTPEDGVTDETEETSKARPQGDSLQSVFDDKVKVRVSRLTSRRLKYIKEMDVTSKRLQKLEQSIKEKLEKSGLDTGGRKIEVKLAAGFFDEDNEDGDGIGNYRDGGGFHTLSEEETNQFHNMIVTLLTGSQEALDEMEHQRKLEQNYKFSWKDTSIAVDRDEEEDQ